MNANQEPLVQRAMTPTQRNYLAVSRRIAALPGMDAAQYSAALFQLKAIHRQFPREIIELLIDAAHAQLMSIRHDPDDWGKQ